jgi:hypothetical protein
VVANIDATRRRQAVPTKDPEDPNAPPPRSSDPHAAGHDIDPRPYVAALLELCALGWYVTRIRPNRDAPVLWRVTITRYNECASITVTEADPDDAFDELLRYARTDAEAPRPSTSERRATLRLLPDPVGSPDERPPGHGPEEP